MPRPKKKTAKKRASKAASPKYLPGTGRKVALPPKLAPLLVPIGSIILDPSNPRTTKDVGHLASLMERFGFTDPLGVSVDGTIEAGHQRLAAAKMLGATQVPTVVLAHDPTTAAAYNLAHNRANEVVAGWDELARNALLAKLHAEDEELTAALGWAEDELAAMLAANDGAGEGGTGAGEPSVLLADRFGMVPFTVFDARKGPWQERKSRWIASGIVSADGRSKGLVHPRVEGMSDPVSIKMFELKGGTSIFDPVLAELLLHWFCPVAGRVLDPFAGGSVRGVVTAAMNRDYVGIDLRQEQVDANNLQWAAFKDAAGSAEWICGDSEVALDDLQPDFDMILGCPPYFDLEVYSDDPKDVSNASDYEAFMRAYRSIIAKSVGLLRPDSFACWVVGEMRDRHGFYRGFVPDTVRAFMDAGARLYNEAILVNMGGTLPLRAAKPFETSRKLGKCHQNVLVFYKGDPKNIRARLGDIEVHTGDDEAED